MIPGPQRIGVALSVVSFLLCSAAISANAELTRNTELTNPDLPNRKGVEISDVVTVHAAAKAVEVLDTNVFLSDSDTKFDAVTVLSPSFGVEIPFRDNTISADYEMSSYLYGTWNSQNHIDHQIRGLVDLNLTDYKITVKDNFRAFTDRAADENSLRLRRTYNAMRAGVAAEFERLGFDVGYTNRLEMYGSKDLAVASLTYEDKDRLINAVDLTVSYRFLPKTWFLVENDLGFVHYYNSSQVPGSWYDETLAGFKGEWFSKLDLDFKAGLRFQIYDNSDIIADKSYVGAVMRGGFNYHPTPRDTASLRLEKTIYESTYSTMNYYDMNQVGVTYRHTFTDKLSADLFGAYQLSLYPSATTENGSTGKRYDNFLTGGASVRYDMRKWASFEIRYEYRQKISKFDIYDYIDNATTFRGTVGF